MTNHPDGSVCGEDVKETIGRRARQSTPSSRASLKYQAAHTNSICLSERAGMDASEVAYHRTRFFTPCSALPTPDRATSTNGVHVVGCGPVNRREVSCTANRRGPRDSIVVQHVSGESDGVYIGGRGAPSPVVIDGITRGRRSGGPSSTHTTANQYATIANRPRLTTIRPDSKEGQKGARILGLPSAPIPVKDCPVLANGNHIASCDAVDLVERNTHASVSHLPCPSRCSVARPRIAHAGIARAGIARAGIEERRVPFTGSFLRKAAPGQRSCRHANDPHHHAGRAPPAPHAPNAHRAPTSASPALVGSTTGATTITRWLRGDGAPRSQSVTLAATRTPPVTSPTVA